MILKKWKESYIRSWQERDNFEKYSVFVFAAIILGSLMIVPESERAHLSEYLNLLTILFMALIIGRIRKAKRQVLAQNKEIEMQKRLIEEHQKEIIDSITYARRIQTSLLPTEKYIDRILTKTNKNTGHKAD